MAKQHYRENVSLKDKEQFAKYLAEGEELILVTGLSRAYLRRIFIMGLGIPGLIFIVGAVVYQYFKASADSRAIGYGLLVGLFLAIIAAGARTFIAYHGHRYLLTTRRVLVKKGFFAVDLTSAMYDKITHIETVQNFFERMVLHHGKVIINTAGMNKNEIVLPFVDYPIEFKNILERLINREREQLGHQSGPVQTLEGELVE